jgi:hypothetical protein
MIRLAFCLLLLYDRKKFIGNMAAHFLQERFRERTSTENSRETSEILVRSRHCVMKSDTCVSHMHHSRVKKRCAVQSSDGDGCFCAPGFLNPGVSFLTR